MRTVYVSHKMLEWLGYRGRSLSRHCFGWRLVSFDWSLIRVSSRSGVRETYRITCTWDKMDSRKRMIYDAMSWEDSVKTLWLWFWSNRA